MKKLLFAVAAVAAVAFASCGSKPKAGVENAEPVVDTTALAPELKVSFEALSSHLTNALNNNDSAEVSKALANLVTMYKTLANSGQIEELKRYGIRVKSLVEEHAAEIKNLAAESPAIAKLYANVEALPVAANTTLEEAKAAVPEETVGMASKALQKGAEAGATAEAATEALKNAPAAANEAVSKAMADTKETTKEAVEDAKQEVSEAAGNTKHAAKKVANDAKQEVSEAAGKTKNATNKAVNNAKKEINEAAKNTKDAVNKAAKATKKEVNKAAHNVKDKLGL